MTHERKRRMLGYARVSTEDQNLDLQIAALKDAGVPGDLIYTDKRSGIDDARPGLNEALRGLFEGDVLVVWKLDRLARSISHLVRIRDFVAQRGAHLQVISPPLETETPAGKLMWGVIASMAEFERDLISERTKAGIAKKKATGQWKGRSMAITPAKWRKAHAMMKEGNSLKAIAKAIKVSYETVRRYQKALRERPESPETDTQ